MKTLHTNTAGTAQGKCSSCGLLVEVDGSKFRSSEGGARELPPVTTHLGNAITVDQCPALSDGQTHRPF